MPEWMYYVNFALNLLIIPLIKILWDMKQCLTKLAVTLQAHSARLDRLERQQDAG